MGVIMKNKINYTGASSGDGAVIYSEEEREVGVWTDGKPLYQKAIILTGVNITGTVGFATSLSNIDKIATIYGTIQENGSQSIYTLPWAGLASTGVYFNKSDNKVYFKSSDTFSNATIYLNFQYTKTTDTPGSGIWTTTGEYAHHYSTDEKVVGTWIDGKTLYEKTIDFGALPLTTTKTLAHNIANVDKIWAYDGFVYSTGGLFYQLNRTTNNLTYQWETTVDRTNVRMQDFAAFGNDHSAIITVRYTKTTD